MMGTAIFSVSSEYAAQFALELELAYKRTPSASVPSAEEPPAQEVLPTQSQAGSLTVST
jgi:hypothetical protein